MPSRSTDETTPYGPCPYGQWPSPLTAAQVAAGRRSRSGLATDGEALYWLESRPDDDGRQVLVRAEPGGPAEDVSPAGTSLRSRVHEYGGGAYCLLPAPGSVAYVDQADQRVYRLDAGRAPVALTPPPPAGTEWRHGDLSAAGPWVLAVRETLTGDTVRRAIVAVDLDGAPSDGALDGGPGEAVPPNEVTVLVDGRDFFAAPRARLDGADVGRDPTTATVAWVGWDHPDMSWDASELWVGDLGAGPDGRPAVTGSRRVAGGRAAVAGPDDESVGQPTWLADGSLLFVSDAGGWWQPWRWAPAEGARRLVDDAAEYHGPDWQLGQATLAELADGRIACRRRHAGLDQVGTFAAGGGPFEPLDQPCVAVDAVVGHRGSAAWLGATAVAVPTVWWDGPTGPSPCVDRGPGLLDPADVAAAEPFELAGRTGRTVHGLFYRPVLGGVRGPDGDRPPLVVFCHGGPTGNAGAGFDPVVQFLTTRGFAVAAVDYAGSTGYGRDYRRALWGEWGVADVDDCVDAARHLVADGLVDGARLAIRGGSAGGLTALGALVRSDTFAAAASWYGVTDLLALAASTHDFEARYLDRLVGPLPAATAEYRRRSPVHRVDEIDAAVLVLQGLDDPVVPPSQATAMVDALVERGRRCEYLAFPGEAHGFRRAETTEAALRAELAFYQEVLGLG
jgi:dienelactone hydrolase